ncbi:MAG: exosortase B [Rubrivivax sp.]|nr:exosortase B [Rubrivivax sp.]
MSAATMHPTGARSIPIALGCLLAGWAALYGPVYWQAFETLWQTEDQGHGPLVLVVAAWLFWQSRDGLRRLPDRSAATAGWALVLLGLSLYLVGRLLAFHPFTFGSQVPLVAGLLLLSKGMPGLRLAWFAVLFLIFMVPLPGSLVDASTQSLKQWISVLVTEILHAVGYPISRTGVTLSIGQYQLLVADACSGMHSMFSLSALGSLYVYLMARERRLHNAIMLALILPTAFFANIIRVIILVLITYYFGEEAGRGFLHGFAGLALLAVSLLMLFLADAVLLRVIKPRGALRQMPAA